MADSKKSSLDKLLEEDQRKKEAKKQRAKEAKKPTVKIRCRKCGRLLVAKSTNYYEATDPFIDTKGYMSVCKDCIRDIFEHYYSLRNNLEYAVFNTCKDIDLIFDERMFETFQSQINTRKKNKTLSDNIGAWFGEYKSVVHRVKGNTEGVEDIRFYDSPMFHKKTSEKNVQMEVSDIDADVIKRFGKGYTEDQYRAFQEKWDELSPSYNHASKIYTEFFKRYIILSVQESDLYAAGEIDKAKKISAEVSKAATDARITPKQMSEADLQGGLDSFGDLALAVEKVNEISPILPKHRLQPNDALDFILWRYINAVEDIKGVPHSSYEDMTRYYDKRVQEYIDDYGDPFGMFEDDPTVKNRDNVKNFIKKTGIEKDVGL